MNKNPEILMADIPVTSPYYDRLRSLNIQMDFVPYGSPEYQYLDHQITELEHRAHQRMEANQTLVW